MWVHWIYLVTLRKATGLNRIDAMRVTAVSVRGAQSVFRRLARDERGNVLIISAVAIIPMLAMIGGAIDASRLYMARTRLQQACDAGALAGRKAMADQNVLADSEKVIARNFFDFNFPTGTYQASNIVKDYVRGTKIGTVVGTASIVMPTTIMQFFGYATVPMSVTCESTLSIPNTDVMFVLDVTGSMLDTPAGDTQNKISGLKQAVGDFYAALGPGTPSGAGRVRYGFMPYSSNVNVGKLIYALNPNFIVGGSGSEQWTYRSRAARLSPNYYISDYGMESGQTPTGSNETAITFNNNWNNLNQDYDGYPNSYGLTLNCTGRPAPGVSSSAGPPATGVQDEAVQYPDTTQTRVYTTTQTNTVRRYRYAYSNLACRLQYDVGTSTKTSTSTSTRPVTWKQKFVAWEYKPVSFDVSQVVQNGIAANPAYFTGYAPDTNPNINFGPDGNGNNYTTPTPDTITWGGCIEEARTTNTITATSSLDVPSGADDLKIDLVPYDTQTRWKPYLPAVQYDSSGNWLGRNAGWIASGFAACPREASPLTQYQSDFNATTKTSASFMTYVNSLTAVGGTYHDIGLIWGARFLSPDGIYSATNSDTVAPGGFQVSRHIVFMTDGTLDTRPNANDPWGINNLEGRIAPASTSEAGLEAIHKRRTSIICNAMKGKGFTIWVVGFGLSAMPQELQDCATDRAHWTLATDSANLRIEFQKIAQTIGGLRLSS